MNKINRIVIVNIIVLLIESVTSFAGEKQTSIDIIEAQCISKNPSTTGMNNCTHDAEIKWDVEMNKYYKLLLNKLNKSEGTKLREAQRAWIKFRDKEFGYINLRYFEPMEGSMYTNIAIANKEALVKQRVLDLEDYYHILLEQLK